MEDKFEKAINELVELHRQYGAIKRRISNVCRDIAVEVATNDVCWTCCWFSGKTCQRSGSPFHNQEVDPMANTCALYLHTKLPRAEIIAKVGQPMGRSAMAKIKRKCNHCFYHIQINRNGKLFRHDHHGVALRGIVGNRKVCPGSNTDDFAETSDSQLPSQ